MGSIPHPNKKPAHRPPPAADPPPVDPLGIQPCPAVLR